MTTIAMKICARLLILFLMLFGTVTEAAPPATETDAADTGTEYRDYYPQGRMTELHQALKLAPAQEADWNTWSARVEQARTTKKAARPDFRALKQLPAPERLEKLLAFSKERQAFLEDILAATKTYYATLTPEQRKVFDELMPFGSHGPKGMGRRGPHRPWGR